VRQDDACKEIICNAIPQRDVDDCQFSCNEHLGYISVGPGNGFICTCMWKHNTLCRSSNPLTQSLEEADFHLNIVFVTTLKLWVINLNNSSLKERRHEQTPLS
jgi:hypothetical protein